MTKDVKSQVSDILDVNKVGEELSSEVLSKIAGGYLGSTDGLGLGGDGFDMNNNNTGGDGAYSKTWGKST